MYKVTDQTKLKFPQWKKFTANTKDDFDKYVHKFTVYSYNKNPILFGLFTVNSETSEVIVDVKREDDNSIYPPFYHYYYGNFETILNKIRRKISIEMEKYKIKCQQS